MRNPASMRTTRALLGAALLAALGCGESGGGPDPDGGMPEDGSEPIVCEEVATSCPAEDPLFPGAPCEGALSCTYDAGSFGEWLYECVDGAWFTEPPCIEAPGGSCAPPPLAERCREPFEGELPGASVAIGPASSGTFRPFEDGERIEAIIGGQGAAMIELQVHLEGADALSCADVLLTLEYGGDRRDVSRTNVAVHCGEALRLFAILPFAELECAEGEHDLRVEVTVAGVGAAAADLRIEGGYLCFG